MKNKVKVVHYIPGFNDGGIESRLLDWYRNIDKNKIEFVVIKMGDNLSDKANEFIKLDGKFRNIPYLKLKNIFCYFKELKKVLKEEKPDVVHVHCMNTGLFCLKSAKSLGIKTRILHSRTTDFLPDEKHLLLKKLIKKLTPQYATDFFACSYEAGVWGNGKKNANKTIVIKNGIELPLFVFDNKKRLKKRAELGLNDKFIIGTIGRLSSQKNLTFLIEVFNKILTKDKEDKYHLVIVGSGNMKETLKMQARKLDIVDRISFIEAQNDVWNYYMAFDIFVSTSFYEGFGTTAIESQATGLPTILSTGFPETVEISDYVMRISLSERVDYWSDSILKMKIRNRTRKDAEKIEQKGYSAKAVAKLLENYYIDSINK